MTRWTFSPAGSRFFALTPDAGAAFGGHARAAAPLPPLRLLWTLAAHLPESCRATFVSDLWLALRQRWGQPDLAQSANPPARERFGLHGEALRTLSTQELRQRLQDELREALRTLEAGVSRTRLNWYLAMHCARIGQLYRELTCPWRGVDALAELRRALGR
jgi:hypothetical protein